MTAITPLAAFAARRVRPVASVQRPRVGWQPGRGAAMEHRELFASTHEASGAGLALAMALDEAQAQAQAQTKDERPWLWVQDAVSLRRTGRPYQPGLPPTLRHRLIHVAAKTPEDALFALEEGLRCRDLAFVIGELAGNPKALGFTASRRLSFAAQQHGTPLWLVRLDAARDLSSARMRWEVRAAPSLPPRWNGHAPGQSTWHAELFRARSYPPGEWILRDDGLALRADAVAAARTPDYGDLAGGLGDRPLAAG